MEFVSSGCLSNLRDVVTADKANIDLNMFDYAVKGSSRAFMLCSWKELNHTTRDKVVGYKCLVLMCLIVHLYNQCCVPISILP